jgi:signal transduction histidine kinase
VRGLQRQFDIVLSERNRIARELHDTLIQGFSGVTMQLQALAGKLSPAHTKSLQEIIQDAANCLKETRLSVAGLRSDQRPPSGLSAAIAQAALGTDGLAANRLNLKIEKIPHSLPADVEYNLLRIAQEALTNAARHSKARLVEVVLRPSRDRIRLSIRDDGSGFAANGADAARGHFGLIGMKERADGIGALLDIASSPGGGTTVSVELPVADLQLENHGDH